MANPGTKEFGSSRIPWLIPGGAAGAGGTGYDSRKQVDGMLPATNRLAGLKYGYLDTDAPKPEVPIPGQAFCRLKCIKCTRTILSPFLYEAPGDPGAGAVLISSAGRDWEPVLIHVGRMGSGRGAVERGFCPCVELQVQVFPLVLTQSFRP